MTRGRTLGLRTGAAACVLATALLWWPAPANAEGEAQVGWWYRLSGESGSASSGGSGDAGGSTGGSSTPPTLPPSPAPIPTVPTGEDGPPPLPGNVPPAASVPEGGFYVANDAFGPLAMAAIRFDVGQVGDSELTIEFADGAAGAALPIVACPLLEGFAAVANGAWRDRPAHDCARASSGGTIGSDGSLVFRLSSAFQVAGQETLDVVILPEPGSGVPFSAPFQPVGPDSLEVVGAAPERVTPTTAAGFTPDPSAPAAAFNGGGAGAGSGSAFVPPAGGATPAVPAAGAGEGAGAGGADDDGATVPGVQPVADLFEDRPWARWVATGLLGALAVGMTAASTGRMPAFAGVGSTGAPEKGIGRFARRREGPPPALT